MGDYISREEALMAVTGAKLPDGEQLKGNIIGTAI